MVGHWYFMNMHNITYGQRQRGGFGSVWVSSLRRSPKMKTTKRHPHQSLHRFVRQEDHGTFLLIYLHMDCSWQYHCRLSWSWTLQSPSQILLRFLRHVRQIQYQLWSVTRHLGTRSYCSPWIIIYIRGRVVHNKHRFKVLGLSNALKINRLWMTRLFMAFGNEVVGALWFVSSVDGC